MLATVLDFYSYKQVFKAVDSLRARNENLLKGSLKQKIFYLHINKCGGSSINQALKSCYYNWNIVEDRNLAHLKAIPSFMAAKIKAGQANFLPNDEVDNEVLKFRENILLYYMSQENIKYISGHFSFSETAYRYFSQKYAFITVLREPVSRWISSYFYNRYKSIDYCKIQTDIEEYLESELGQSHGREYIKLLIDPHENQNYTSAQAIEKAKQNLDKFSLVGCLEYQQDFINKFKEIFGKKLLIHKINKNPKSNAYQKSIVTENLKKKVREICQPDIEIYNYALTKFVNKNVH